MTPLEKARARLATVEQIAELIGSGRTMTETARLVGVDFENVRGVVRRLKLPYGKRDLDARNSAIRKAHKDGYKTAAIAKQHGITAARVWQILSGYGIKRSKARAKARVAEKQIPVPFWVPGNLIRVYRVHAVAHGEEKAASHVRRLKAAKTTPQTSRAHQ